MTDQIPAPSAPTPAPPGPQALTVDEVLALEQKLRENKQAQMRGDPMPHDVTPQQLRDAIMAIRMQRGTLPLQSEKKNGKGGKKSGGATVIEINLDL